MFMRIGGCFPPRGSASSGRPVDKGGLHPRESFAQQDPRSVIGARQSHAGSDSLPIAETKLLPPRLRAEMVERPRIQEALERDDVALTLIAAPPGYGKTVA